MKHERSVHYYYNK